MRKGLALPPFLSHYFLTHVHKTWFLSVMPEYLLMSENGACGCLPSPSNYVVIPPNMWVAWNLSQCLLKLVLVDRMKYGS